MRSALRHDLRSALAAGDRTAVAALRSAIAAIDNAQAPTLDDGSASLPAPTGGVGVGSTEIDRLDLDEDELRSVLRAELDESLSAAAQFDALDRPDDAAAMRARAAVVARYLT
ncbi:glutamyl-tRNA amidotransferase [Williamsia sp. M5A3_1d]